MTSLTRLMAVANEAVDLARETLLGANPGHITGKGDRDMVTEADFRVERAVRTFLAHRSPGIGFLGEEEGGTGSPDGPMWVLDPIDGTANFVRGMPLCGISLGLLDEGHGALGVVDLPFLHARYTAVRAGGAYRDGEPIRVSTTTELRDVIAAVGDYAVGADAEEGNVARHAVTAKLAGTVQRVRMFGTAATDLAWLAAGHVDVAITLSNKPWDMTAGAVIAREAGAVITDRAGIDHTLSSRETVAANPHLHRRLLDLINT